MADFADDGLSLHEFGLEYGRQGETQGNPERKLLRAVLEQAVADLGVFGYGKIGMRNKTRKVASKNQQDAEHYFRDIGDERITSLNGVASVLNLDAAAVRSAMLGRFKPLRRCPSCNTSRPPVC